MLRLRHNITKNARCTSFSLTRKQRYKTAMIRKWDIHHPKKENLLYQNQSHRADHKKDVCVCVCGGGGGFVICGVGFIQV